MDSPAAPDPIADARQLAKNHGLFIVEDHDRIYDKKEARHRYVTVWIVYRGMRPARPVRLGKRRDPRSLLRYLRTLI